MQSFLLTQVGGNENIQDQIDEPQENNLGDKFIIVETNFRVIAYTNNKLYKEILKLFIETQIEFPNMLLGKLTKKKFEEAFKMRISAKQIMSFLESHAHPEAKYAKAKEKHTQIFE